MSRGKQTDEIEITVWRRGYPKTGTRLKVSAIRAHRWVYEYGIAIFTDPEKQAAADRAIAAPEPTPLALHKDPEQPPPAPEGEPGPPSKDIAQTV